MAAAVPNGGPFRTERGRLRFVDEWWERRFQEERHIAALPRVRIMLLVGILVVAGLGFAEMASGAARAPEYLAMALRVRFLAVVPIWLLALGSTWLPGHTARADTLYATATLGVCWALAFLKWPTPIYLPNTSLVSAVMADVLAALLISVFSLPMRFPHLVAGTLAATLGVGAFFLVTKPGVDARNIALTMGGIGGLVVVMMWHREANERLAFAQREELAALNRELARLNAEKNEFLAIASHDLRAPLASVRGLAEQLQSGRFPDPAKQAQAQGAMVDLTGRMLQLVNDFLGAHVLEHGALPVQLRRLDLQEAAAQAAARHAPLAEAKAQRVEIAAGPTVWVSADDGLLAQVADNFVSNAIKFSPRGSVIRLAVAAAEDGRTARLEVADRGPGIAPEDQPKLFRHYARVGPRPTGGESSHGLGLAVAKRLAEAMGGHVGCKSAAGAGSTFWVELTMAPDEANDGRTPARRG